MIIWTDAIHSNIFYIISYGGSYMNHILHYIKHLCTFMVFVSQISV